MVVHIINYIGGKKYKSEYLSQLPKIDNAYICSENFTIANFVAAYLDEYSINL